MSCSYKEVKFRGESTKLYRMVGGLVSTSASGLEKKCSFPVLNLIINSSKIVIVLVIY